MASIDLASCLGIPNLPLYIDQIDQALAKALATDNPYISGPLTRLTKHRGKRLRPTLLIAVASSQGKKIDKTVISACVAVELVHIASLVHDDIIDEAAIRWNEPTVNSVESNASSILIGDLLLARACLEGAKISAMVGETIASTIVQMCDGQSRELGDQFNIQRTQKAYNESIKGKTSALFSAACEIGGICAGLNSSHVKRLSRYGEEFGMLFQIFDDLVDILSTPALSGKETGNDATVGVYTLPILLSLTGPNRDKLVKLLKAMDGHQVGQLIEILTADGSLSKTLKIAKTHSLQATEALDGFVGRKMLSNLATFPSDYLQWSVDNLISSKYKTVLS